MDYLNNIKNSVKNLIIWLFLTIISLGAVTYVVNLPIEYDTNLMYEYKD